MKIWRDNETASAEWLGAWDGGRGLRRLAPAEAFHGTLLRGTLAAELRAADVSPGQALTLLDLRHPTLARRLRIEITADARLAVTSEQGDRQSAVSVRLGKWVAADLRISFSWDAPAGRSWLTVERPGRGTIRQGETPSALPLPACDVAGLLGNPASGWGSALPQWFAIARGIVPVAPGPGLAGTTPVLTPEGYRPAALIGPGDLVETLNDGPMPVLRVARVCLPAYGSWRPLRLLAPYHGNAADIVLAPHHRVAISGASVEYLFGADTVLVEARHLVDGRTARPEPKGAMADYHSIVLDRPALLVAAGVGVESLNIGALGQSPDLLATSTLATALTDGASNALPLHGKPEFPVLRPFEIRALCALHRDARAPLMA